jgi:cysteine-rich repeat protein
VTTDHTAREAHGGVLVARWSAPSGPPARGPLAGTALAVPRQVRLLIASSVLLASVVTRAGAPVCGNHVVDAGETCDDGNQAPGDGCDATCHHEPACGDGTVDPGEACDDGNRTGGDGCDDRCRREHPAVCGDGIKEGDEECDDGNLLDRDSCDSTCVIERVCCCGNGSVDRGEECDDGNDLDGDGCSAGCKIDPMWRRARTAP